MFGANSGEFWKRLKNLLQTTVSQRVMGIQGVALEKVASQTARFSQTGLTCRLLLTDQPGSLCRFRSACRF